MKKILRGVEQFMDANTALLAAVALIPAIVLCGYVYYKDRAEKEPIGFLLLLFGLGAFCAVPVLMISDPVNELIDGFFSVFGEDTGDTVLLGSFTYQIYLFISNTIGVALIEEGFKWLFLFFVTRNSKHFNSLFDGLIYAVFISLGFAALENVLYTFDYGLSTGLLRAVTAVPGHMFDGVLMGYYYTMWNVFNEAGKLENAYTIKGIITPKSRITGKSYLILSIVVPVLAHGIYDYFCSYPSYTFTILFYVFLIALYITQFKRIRDLSRVDKSEMSVAEGILFKKYPQLPVYLEMERQKAAEQQVPAGPFRVNIENSDIRIDV